MTDKLTATGDTYNVGMTTFFLFDAENYDPVTTKPLARVSGMLDETGKEIPPFLVTCNTLMAAGLSAQMALGMWNGGITT